MAIEHAIQKKKKPVLYFLPTAAAPHKKKSNVSFLHRFRMLRLLLNENEFVKRYAKISVLERYLPKPNYTIQVLQKLKGYCPNTDFVFLLGQDMFEALPNWYKPEEIAKLVTFWVIPRHSKNIHIPKIPFLQYEVLPEFAGFESSTQARQDAFRKNVRSLQKELPESVYHYIQKHHLYES